MVFPHAIFYFFQFWMRLVWLGLLLLVFGCFFVLIFAAKLGTTGWKVAVLSLVTMGIAVLIFWGLHYVFGLAAVSGVTLPQTGPYFLLLGPSFGIGLLLSQLWHLGFLHIFDYLSPALGPGVNWSWNDRPSIQFLYLEILRPNVVLLYRPNDMSASFGPYPNHSICSIMKAQFWVACFGKSSLSIDGLILVQPLSTSRIHVWQAQFNWVFPGLLAARFWAWAHYFCCYRWMLKARSRVLLLLWKIRAPLKEYNGLLLDKDVYFLAIYCNRIGCLVLVNSFPRVLLRKHIIPTRMLNVSRCCMFFFVFSNTKACFGISLLDGGGMPL